MPEKKSTLETEPEQYPLEPRYHPVNKIVRKVYDTLSSAKLAMALLVAILLCCLAGVIVIRGEQATSEIFYSLWFNALLILLVINVACCFFGRVWGRRITVISCGMILFHLSFVCMFLAIVYNSLFYFRGNIRLTEGESLSSSDPLSYDSYDKGRFFNFSRIHGKTTLIRMNTGYKVDGENKQAAYEVSVGEVGAETKGIIYITHKLTHKGFDYFNDKEGFSLLVDLFNRQGQHLYAAHVPLQSILQQDQSYYYVTGYKDGDVVKPGAILFPHEPQKPLMGLLAAYFPSKLEERSGEVQFSLYRFDEKESKGEDAPFFDGRTVLGGRLTAGDYVLSAREVRYWVGMMVRYEPGKPFILTSLWVGLFGMVLTTIGRMVRSRKQ